MTTPEREILNWTRAVLRHAERPTKQNHSACLDAQSALLCRGVKLLRDKPLAAKVAAR